jgi:hypothetical protein
LVKRGECVTTRKSSTRLGLIAIAIALALSACGAQPTADSRLDDEAMVRAKRAGLSAEDVAYRYYYPDYIDNYFAGMDAIAVLRSAGTAPNAPIDQFDTPVYQLMDKKAPGRVEKLDPIRLPSVVIDKSKRQLCHDTGQPDACEVLGRNTWMMWAGGNEGFWDWIGRQYGFLDFVRLLDTREAGDPNASKKNDRAGRFARGGMINEPGMGPSLDEDGNVFERALGLRIDEPLDKDVREWRRKYVAKALGLDGMGGAPAKAEPGSGYGGSSNYGGSSSYGGVLRGNAVGYPNGKSYDSRIPPPEIYGLSSGVVGLRLFPNPNFDKEALERWLKTKDSYASNPVGDPRLERPFRVGMSCAFCHASFHPLNPPADVANPKWQYRRSVPAHEHGLRQSPAEGQFRLSHPRQPAAGHGRHLSHRVGQHQQSEYDEFRVQPGATGSGLATKPEGTSRRYKRVATLGLGTGRKGISGCRAARGFDQAYR